MNRPEHIHIIAFDVPYPPDYGGVIDIYYKVKALHELGVKVHLHCFQYGRPAARELEEVCHELHYYRRRIYKNPFSGSLPYIVNSRQDESLVESLMKDSYPILFEGLHTTFHITDERLRNRMKIVRMHNIEHHYYAKLEEAERNLFKKYFFRTESERLAGYEKVLKHAQLVAAISPSDMEYLQAKYAHTFYLPAFHSAGRVKIDTGKSGGFVLYHGNLAVGENDLAARFLVNEVFSGPIAIGLPEIQLVIAGNNPSGELQKLVQKNPHVKLESGLSTDGIDALISQAQVNLLPTFQSTGIKLKLLHALFKGRFCMVNEAMVKNTGLEKLCIIKEKAGEMKEVLRDLMDQSFDPASVVEREKILGSRFDNSSNAALLMEKMAELKI